MIYLKSCLRCKGDVHFYSDTWGTYMKCLQCGQTWNSRKLEERADLEAELVANATEPALVAANEGSGYEESIEDPLEDPIEIRRAS
jgi:hypothetical protein